MPLAATCATRKSKKGCGPHDRSPLCHNGTDHQMSGPLSIYRRARKSMKARTLGCVNRPGG